MRFHPFRDLRSVMLLTLHVAVVAYAIRTFAGSTSLAGSLTIWAPLSVLLALFLSIPIGQAVASAFEPANGLTERPCPCCGVGRLRPLLKSGPGLFPPIQGYRCAGCKTTYRLIGDRIVVEPALLRPSSLPGDEVHFFDPVADGGDPGIRFLDDANIPAGPVSDA